MAVDQRVRHFAVAAAERVGQVGEDAARLQLPMSVAALLRGRRLRGVEQTGGAFDGDRVRRLDRAQRQAQIVERRAAACTDRLAASRAEAPARCRTRRVRRGVETSSVLTRPSRSSSC